MGNSTDHAAVVILIEDTGSLVAHERASILSKKLAIPVYEIKAEKTKKVFSQEQWQLVYTASGLALRLSTKPEWGDILVDFSAAHLLYRQQHGGGKKEPLVRALGLHKSADLNVLDCTAGMGTDGFIMAANGALVTLVERQRLVAALLEDALLRAIENNVKVAQSMRLECLDACEYMQSATTKFDVIYLDPMFPHKKKSALVKKEMQAFQKLVGKDEDSENVLSVALDKAMARVVVKRPSYAQPIKNQKNKLPDLSVTSKKHRFDVYLTR